MNRLKRSRPARFVVAASIAAAGVSLVFGDGASVWALQPEVSELAASRSAPLGPSADPASIPPPSLAEALARGRLLRAAVASAHPNQDQAGPFAEIDACVAEEMAATDTPGASVAVSVDGAVVFAQGYGVKHEGQDGAVDAETLFRIGSTTKMMIAAAVMQQVEAGKVDLNQPLSTYLPEWDIAGAWDAPEVTGTDMTPWHLLTHTTASPDRIFIDTGLDGPMNSTALADWARLGVTVTLHAPPGSFWNYSNPGFSLAGLIVQNVSGIPYRQYVRENVWVPAGMDATYFWPEVVIAHGNYTYGHRSLDPTTGDEIVYGPADYDNFAAGPAGYAFSHPTDMVRWADLLMRGGGDVLSQASVDAMQAAQTSRDIIPGLDYGYGIFRTDDAGLDRVIFDHGGNIPGWSSQLYWSPDDRLAISVLANTITSLSGSAGCALLAMLGVEPLDGPGFSTIRPLGTGTWAATAACR